MAVSSKRPFGAPAIDRDGDAVDVAGSLGGQKGNQSAQLFRLPDPPYAYDQVLGVRAYMGAPTFTISWGAEDDPYTGTTDELRYYCYAITEDFDPETVDWEDQPSVNSTYPIYYQFLRPGGGGYDDTSSGSTWAYANDWLCPTYFDAAGLSEDLDGEDPAADELRVGFQDHRCQASFSQVQGGGQAGNPGADDHNIVGGSLV